MPKGSGLPKDPQELLQYLRKEFLYYQDKSLKYLGNKEWSLNCPVCDQDFLSEANPEYKNFTISTAKLKRGKPSCRCTKHWSDRDKTAHIKLLLEEQGYTFLGWSGESVGNNKTFNYLCDLGHKGYNNYGNIKQGKGCKTCASSTLRNIGASST